MQKLRDGQDDLWKTNPQDASLYEDALVVYDNEEAAREIQQKFLLPSEVEHTVREAAEEDEAAMALFDLGNSSHADIYVQDEAVNTLRLRSFNPKRVPETNLPRLKELDEVVQETRDVSTMDAHVAPQREIEVTTAGNDSNTVPTAKTTDHDSRTTKVPNKIAPKTTADNEAALALLSLAYSGTPHNYVEEDMPDNTRALRPFDSSSQGPQKVDTEHEGDMTTPAPKKIRAAQETPDKPSTSTPVKSRLLRYEDSDDNEDTQTSPVKTVPKKTKTKKTATNAQPQLNPPAAGLPLTAPPNTAGIPNDALALNEHFKKDHPSTLGVQLPVNRARTRWDWTDYVTRKTGNAQFDWSNELHVRDVNRWRQQRIRRRLAEHGVVRDGRKHND